jgi:GTP-binding protein EngB required for normal cell division
MDLREYERSKFAIAEILRSASACVTEQADDVRASLQGLFARLAEDRFNLVVVGRFNRGKTSLMNAILATDRLPTGIIPLTSVITSVAYGSKERILLKYQNRILDSEVSIEALSKHITQEGNPGNIRKIKTAEIQLPAEILRRGFYFIDTPGLGSAILENTLTTEAFLPEADAFILVTSYESPLSEEELRFFKASVASGKRIFVAVNKQDTVSPEQRAAALSFMRRHLEVPFGQGSPAIFSISSTDGLKGKMSGDHALLEASGIVAFERQLLDFLLTEKSNEFLLGLCARARQFLLGLPQAVDTQELVARIDAFEERLDRPDRRVATEAVSMPAAAFPDLQLLPPCEICARVTDEVWNFLCKYQYEIIISNDEQRRLAERGGLCPFHTWQLEATSSPYGICAGHAPLLDRFATKLRHMAATLQRQKVVEQLENMLPDEHACVICSTRDNAEQEAINATANRLERDPKRAINDLSAICFPHFVLLLAAVRDAEVARMMLERQATVLERHADDMKRFAIKHDGLRRHLTSQEEATAAERGLLLIAGRRQVNFVSLARIAHGRQQETRGTNPKVSGK